MDGVQLAQLIIEYGVGVATETVYEIKRIDSDLFYERVMVLLAGFLYACG